MSVQRLNEMQMMLLVREAQAIRSTRQTIDRKFQAIATILDIIETAVVDGEDREYLMSLAATGQIEFGEMLGIATAFQDHAKESKPVKAVRRAARR